MARKASSKPDSGTTSTATIGFEADFGAKHADTFRRDLRGTRDLLLSSLLSGQINLKEN